MRPLRTIPFRRCGQKLRISPRLVPYEEILARLETLGVMGRRPSQHRVWVAVLNLYEEGDGDLSSLMKTAKEDYRDVLAWAKLPNQVRFGPTDDPEKARQLREMDRLQYQTWLNR